jgi:hypothetical protein
MKATPGTAHDVRVTRGEVRKNLSGQKLFSSSVWVFNARAMARADAIAWRLVRRPPMWWHARRQAPGVFSTRRVPHSGRVGMGGRAAETAGTRSVRWRQGGTNVALVKAKERGRQRKKRVDTINVKTLQASR